MYYCACNIVGKYGKKISMHMNEVVDANWPQYVVGIL